MSTWQEKNAALLAELAETPNPSVRGNAIGCYLRDARKDHKLTLYEQYVLETEKLSYERLAWTQPGWSRRAGISDLLKVLNIKMMALLFQEKEAAEMWDAWGLEAYQLNQEKRPHYILDDYLTYLRAERTPDALEKLLAARRSRRRPFDKGPYHDEYYPGEQCAYEELLLQGRFFQAEDKKIRSEIEELLVELYLLQE